MLGVQDLLGALDVVGVLGALGPGQFEDGVEPGPDPGALGALVGGALQLVDLLERGLADVTGQVGGLDAGPVVVGLVLRVAVELGELLAYGVELAPQQELALLLVDALLDVLGDGLGDVLLGEVFAEPLDGELQPGDRVGRLQQPHLLGGGEEGGVPGVVGERGDALDLLDPVHDLPGAALLEPTGGEGLVLLDQLGDGPGQRVGDGGVHPDPFHPERGAGAAGARSDADPVAAPDEGARIAVGEPSDLLHGPEDPDPGVRPVDARDEQHLGLAPVLPGGGLRGLDGGAHLGVGQVERHHHSRQHDLVVERQHGQGERCDGSGLSSHDLPFGSQVELYRLNACEPRNVPQALFALSDQACRLLPPAEAGAPGALSVVPVTMRGDRFTRETHMGTWDVGPFDNDTAADWCGGLDDAAPEAREEMVRAALAETAGTTDYLDSDVANEAIAAAALVAAQCPGVPPPTPRTARTSRFRT